VRVVFDTNIYIAAFVADGICARLVRRARKREFELLLCQIIIHEFSSKLKVKFRCTSKEIEQACSLISEAAAADIWSALTRICWYLGSMKNVKFCLPGILSCCLDREE
jgi:predicted nucleic acid-binding protein